MALRQFKQTKSVSSGLPGALVGAVGLRKPFMPSTIRRYVRESYDRKAQLLSNHDASSWQWQDLASASVATKLSGFDYPSTPLDYRMISASGIKPLIEERAPWLDAENYTAAAQVFPMRANNYVVDQLIDWQNVPNDPIFRLVFPQPEMLEPEQLDRIKLALRTKASGVVLRSLAEQIRQTLNPHPSNQKTENVPADFSTGSTLAGIQHKYRETVLFFPTEGQYCHSFCTYCFRWAQFTAVGSDQAFQSKDVEKLTNHLAASPDVSDLLFTGGDPMVMKTHHWEKYLDPILKDPRLGHIATIRIGTKSLAYWPERFVNDADAASTLNLFRRVIQSGRQVSIMAHFSHAVELETPLVREAIRRIRATGAQIRCQAPLIRGINDDPEVWSKMWRTQTRLGLNPYYMFVERDTGAKHFFEVPLEKAFDIYKQASSSVAGTARTANGPSMSASPGKIQVVGICELPSPTPGAGAARPGHEKVFVLRFLQGRNPDWCRETMFARFDPNASWFDELKPAFGQARWFFEEEYNQLRSSSAELGSSGQRFVTSFAGRDRAGFAVTAERVGVQSGL